MAQTHFASGLTIFCAVAVTRVVGGGGEDPIAPAYGTRPPIGSD